MLIVARNAVEAVKMEDVVDTLHNVIAFGENFKKHYIRTRPPSFSQTISGNEVRVLKEQDAHKSLCWDPSTQAFIQHDFQAPLQPKWMLRDKRVPTLQQDSDIVKQRSNQVLVGVMFSNSL